MAKQQPRFIAPDTEAMSYAGKCRGCGVTVALVADVPGWEKHTARSVAEIIRGGDIVTRMPSRLSVEGFGECECDKHTGQGKLL